jgi:hypothetical protein
VDDIGGGVQAGEAESEAQPLGAALGEGLGAGDQPVLIQPHGHDALHRAVVGRVQGVGGLERALRPRHAVEHGHDAGQGRVTVLDHLGHLVQRAIGRRHPHHGGLETGLQVGVDAFGGGAGAHDLAVRLGLGHDIEEEAARGDQGPADHERGDARHDHLANGRQHIAPNLTTALTQIETPFGK